MGVLPQSEILKNRKPRVIAEVSLRDNVVRETMLNVDPSVQGATACGYFSRWSFFSFGRITNEQ